MTSIPLDAQATLRYKLECATRGLEIAELRLRRACEEHEAATIAWQEAWLDLEIFTALQEHKDGEP